MSLIKEEIKIGNYFIYNNDGFSMPIEWDKSHWLKLCECVIDIENIIPIRISQNQLQKLGFTKSDWTVGGYCHWYKGCDDIWSIRKNENGNWQMCVVTGINTTFCFDPILQYVHQLQNLYFSLTDKELTYK